MTQRAPLETLSALALDVWRFGLSERPENTLVVLARVEGKTGASVDPLALSLACRELERGGWAKRCMSGFKRVPEHCGQAPAVLPLTDTMATRIP